MSEHGNRNATDDTSPLITTTGKVIGFSILVLTSMLGVYGWLLSNRFESIVDSRFDKFELRLTREYAAKSETLTKTEYEVRHAEIVTATKQITERIIEDERRLTEIEKRLLANEHDARKR